MNRAAEIIWNRMTATRSVKLRKQKHEMKTSQIPAHAISGQEPEIKKENKTKKRKQNERENKNERKKWKHNSKGTLTVQKTNLF